MSDPLCMVAGREPAPYLTKSVCEHDNHLRNDAGVRIPKGAPVGVKRRAADAAGGVACKLRTFRDGTFIF